MEIKSHIIEVTENELDIIGEGIEAYLVSMMKVYKKMDTLELLESDSMDLLQRLLYCGYSLTINQKGKKSSWNLKHYHDVREWARAKLKTVVE